MTRREIIGTAAAAAAIAPLTSAKPARPVDYSETREVRLFLRAWGKGRPILFLHSWALDSAMWQYQFLDLAERGHQCVAFDRRGHGRSDVPDSGYDLDTLADDLSRMIERLGLRDLIVVAHSMGAAELLRYVERHGTGRLRRVVLVAPATPCLVSGSTNKFGAPPVYFEELRRRWRQDFPGWIEENKRPFFSPDTSPATMDWVARMMERTTLPVAIATNVAAVEADLRPALTSLDRPTLVIHGDKDASAPIDATGRPTAAGIPNAKLIVYEGAPHGLFVTHAARLSRDIADWAAQ